MPTPTSPTSDAASPPLPSTWPAPQIPEFGPRRVRLSRHARRRLLELRLWSLAVAVIGTGVVWHFSEAKARFVREGQVVQARVTGHRWYGGKSSTYYLIIEFRAGGIPVRREVQVHSRVYGRTQEGDSMTVTALPSDPWSFVIGTVSEKDVREVQVVGTAGVVLLASIFSIAGMRVRWKAGREKEMLAHWPALSAQATQCTQDSPNGAMTTIRYRARFADGSVPEKLFFLPGYANEIKPGDFFDALWEPNTKQGLIPVPRLGYVELAPEERA